MASMTLNIALPLTQSNGWHAGPWTLEIGLRTCHSGTSLAQASADTNLPVTDWRADQKTRRSAGRTRTQRLQKRGAGMAQETKNGSNGEFEQSLSIWMDTAELPEESTLTENISADVCVVGAGIAGMTTGYLLTREGKSVVILDDGPIGGGMTGRTTAHLVNALDDRYFELERLHGEEGSRLAAESHTAAIDKIEEIAADEKINCEFERLDGYLFVPPRESKKVLEDELAAAHRAGLADIEMVERVPWDSFDTGTALRFPRQAQFHPLKYLTGLANAIKG